MDVLQVNVKWINQSVVRGRSIADRGNNEIYRCLNCGSDLEQHVNGKITYLPHIIKPKDADPYVKEWKDGEKV